MAYSIFKFRNFLAASRKSNIRAFGLLGHDRSLDFIDNTSGADEIVTVTGTKNGVNTTFTFTGSFASLWSNGLRLVEGTDYSVTGTTITMVVAPQSSDSLYGIA